MSQIFIVSTAKGFSVSLKAELCNKALTWHQSEDGPKENVKPGS